MTPRPNCERCQLPLHGPHVDNFCARCLKAMSESKQQRDREVALEAEVERLREALACVRLGLERAWLQEDGTWSDDVEDIVCDLHWGAGEALNPAPGVKP